MSRRRRPNNGRNVCGAAEELKFSRPHNGALFLLLLKNRMDVPVKERRNWPGYLAFGEKGRERRGLRLAGSLFRPVCA